MRFNYAIFISLHVLQICQGFSEEALTLSNRLEDTKAAKLLIFKLRDNEDHGMDCLDVFQPHSTKNGTSFGVSHSLRNGVFSVHLSESTDLRNWKHVIELDQHGSQATVHETDDGTFLLAYEKEATAGNDSRFVGAIWASSTLSSKQPRSYQPPNISAKID